MPLFLATLIAAALLGWMLWDTLYEEDSEDFWDGYN